VPPDAINFGRPKVLHLRGALMAFTEEEERKIKELVSVFFDTMKELYGEEVLV
jgi:hypothetical protein